MRSYHNAAALAATVGERQGPSDWLVIDQGTIDGFADVTGDRQWIHVDRARAKREMPDGKTIAHGYLTLSLLGTLMPTVLSVNSKQVLNVGLDRLRFLSPIPEGSRIRLYVTVLKAKPVDMGLRMNIAAQFEIEGCDRPAMIAELVLLYID